MHITTCPHCGSHDAHPIEDGWWCSGCQRDYPTRAYKCPHPDCWEYEFSCKIHNAPAAPAKTSDDAADATSLIRALAKAYRNRILLWLFASLILTFFCGWISDWAGNRSEWEAQIVQFLFGLAGVVSFLSFGVFCVLLYSWLTGYKAAIGDASSFLQDRALYMHIHSDVIGPIPWR
jgi:hypothetical protein